MTPRLPEPIADRLADRRLPAATPATAQAARSPSERVAFALSAPDPAPAEVRQLLAALMEDVPRTLHRAFEGRDETALLEVHKILFLLYEVTFVNPLSPAAAHERSPWAVHLRQTLEAAWLRAELPALAGELPAEPVLTDPYRLAEWFVEQARRQTPTDRRVVRFLAEEASRDDFVTFVTADAHLNYRFYDALALALLHYSETVKAELSRHVWEECGEGDPERAHTRQFTRTLRALGLSPSLVPPWDDWRPYAGYNLYLCLGLSRAHYFKALGSLAMPELFDPDRDRAVVRGLERLRLGPREEFTYYYSHIEGDEDHGDRWLEHVVKPAVAAQPESGRELALGALLRMLFMRRFNEYLARTFGISS
jgi:hypothetical protein